MKSMKRPEMMPNIVGSYEIWSTWKEAGAWTIKSFFFKETCSLKRNSFLFSTHQFEFFFDSKFALQTFWHKETTIDREGRNICFWRIWPENIHEHKIYIVNERNGTEERRTRRTREMVSFLGWNHLFTNTFSLDVEDPKIFLTSIESRMLLTSEFKGFVKV